MLFLFLSAILIQPTSTGQATVGGLPSDAEAYVESPNCTVTMDGPRVSGDAGCTFRLAVISKDGAVHRYWGRLGEDENAEDAPTMMSEDDSQDDSEDDSEDAPMDTALNKASVEQQPSQPTSRLNQNPDRARTPRPFTFGGHLSLCRGVGSFGMVDFGLKASVIYRQQIRLGLGWHRGQARTHTDYLQTEKRVEQSLDLFLFRVGYLHPLSKHLSAYGEAGLGSGRFVTDEVADQRSQISASTQAFLVLRPSLGIQWHASGLSLGLGWQLTYAEGQWFAANEFGRTDGERPPDNTGILDHGLEVSVGVQF